MQLSDISYGLPGREQMKQYRIWDSYFTPSHGHPGKDGFSALLADMDRAKRSALDLGQFEKCCFFPHVGIGTTSDSGLEKLLREKPELVLKPFDHWPGRMLGMIQLNANDKAASLEALNRWLRDGPMQGVYFPGGGPGALCCTHRNFLTLVERIIELGGVIMQHTWFVTGGKPKPGMSTPSELAGLAEKFPDYPIVCAHAGGEWEKGIRAVADHPNIFIETSGFDATAGFIEMAVRELGASRIIFGSHLPSRSLGTELSKVTTADITEAEKFEILGANFRKLFGEVEE